MMKMARRKFLTSTLAGAGGMILGCSGAGAKRAADGPPPGPFEIVPLGKTGLKVSRVGLGTGMHGGNRQSDHTRLGRERLEGLVRAAYDRGIRLFDMADLYGTHPYVGRALKPMPRDQYVLVSKIWVRRGGIPERERPGANILLDRFRKELATDYVDIVQLHCMTSKTWTDEQKKQMDLLENLKAKGIIRAHGISCHSVEAMSAAAASPWVDVVHARVNAFGAAMDAPPEKVAPVLKQLCAAGKGVIGMKLVGEGRFRDDDHKKDESIRWALRPDRVDTMVVGCLSEAEIDDFCGRVARIVKAAGSRA